MKCPHCPGKELEAAARMNQKKEQPTGTCPSCRITFEEIRDADNTVVMRPVGTIDAERRSKENTYDGIERRGRTVVVYPLPNPKASPLAKDLENFLRGPSIEDIFDGKRPNLGEQPSV